VTASFNEGPQAQASASTPCISAEVRPPTLAQREAVSVIAGAVEVRLAGTNTLIPISRAATIPNGSEIDANAGRVALSVATSQPRRTESAEVYGGTFVINQQRTRLGRTSLQLSEPLPGCSVTPARPSPAQRSHAARRRRGGSRHIWVAEHGGEWSTGGRYVSTSVEGTSWLTEDTCNASLVRVSRGRVRARNLLTNRVTVLHAGQTLSVSPHRRRS